jgi:cytidylate kinase
VTAQHHIVIAIDGPAASGKSSVARMLAQRLRFAYVNSGAMYRAVTWHVLRHGVDPLATSAVLELLDRTNIECGLRDRESTILLDGIDPDEDLRSETVNANVSAISSIPEVRNRLVAIQRGYLEIADLVMEGRDIGSTVFPETPYKFYIDASPEVRQRRRAAQGQLDEIARRDQRDSSRRSSPLTIAEDSHVIDSSNLTIDGVVGEIIGRLKMKGLRIAAAEVNY